MTIMKFSALALFVLPFASSEYVSEILVSQSLLLPSICGLRGGVKNSVNEFCHPAEVSDMPIFFS